MSAGQPGRQRGGVGPWESGRRMRPNCALCRDQKYKIQQYKKILDTKNKYKNIRNKTQAGRARWGGGWQGDWKRYICAIQGQSLSNDPKLGQKEDK